MANGETRWAGCIPAGDTGGAMPSERSDASRSLHWICAGHICTPAVASVILVDGPCCRLHRSSGPSCRRVHVRLLACVPFAFPPPLSVSSFFFNDTATTEIYTLSLHDALPI